MLCQIVVVVVYASNGIHLYFHQYLLAASTRFKIISVTCSVIFSIIDATVVLPDFSHMPHKEVLEI